MSAVLAPPRREPTRSAPPPPDPNDPPAVLPRMTRAQYLAFDNAATGAFKYEWIHGKVRAMSGGIFNHHLVSANLMTVLNVLFRALRAGGGPRYAANGQGLRTRVPGGPYYYPDALVSPLPPEIEEPEGEPQRTLLNPVLIAEVLSPSTAATDRIEKRREYLRIPTLEVYLIVQPSVRDVLRLTRHAPDPAQPRRGEKRFRDADVELPRFGVTLPAGEIYADILPGEGAVG